MNDELSIRRIKPGQNQLVQDIIDEAAYYSLNVEGVFPVPDAAETLFEQLPPECKQEQKHVLLIELSGKAVGVCDLVIDYPEEETAFLGLLLFRESYQGQGYGSSAYHMVEQYARDFGMHAIQLAVVDSNPVEDFWYKMGYRRNGREKPYQGINRQTTARVMAKQIHKFF